MVQRKVLSNKLGVQANDTLKMEKKQAIAKPFLQNYDGKNNKGADLKAIKMKKSRSIKRGDYGFSLHSSPMKRVGDQPGEPPTLVTPTKPLQGRIPCADHSTGVGEGWSDACASPPKTTPCNNKSPHWSPNYMKSTSSSKARKENTTKVSISASTSKLHRARETLGKTSSLKRVRTLTKVPSFKHTRAGVNKNVVLCEDNIDAKRATCSSTLKDSKFPPYLELKPGATEAQGTSLMRVCPYTYCSLNGHHHKPSPPLKYFLSSRRKSLKTQKNFKPEIISSSKRKPSEIKVKNHASEMAVILSGMSEMPESPKHDFFVEIYVPEKECFVADDPAPVSESLSETARSEIDFLDGADQNDDTPYLSDSIFSSQGTLDEDSPTADFKSFYAGSDGEVDTVSAVSFDQFFGESSDMEWEEAQVPATHNKKSDSSVQGDCGKGEDEPAFGDLEFLTWKLLPYIHDEIMECLQFSDVDSSSDSEFTQTDEEQVEEQVLDDKTISPIDPFEEHDKDPSEESTEAQRESLDSLKDLNNSDGDYSNEDHYISYEMTEGNNTDIVMEGGISGEFATENVPAENVGAKMGQTDVDEGEFEKPAEENLAEEKENADENAAARARATYFEVEHDSHEVNLRSKENGSGEAEVSEIEDIDMSKVEGPLTNVKNQSQDQVKEFIPRKQIDSSDELQDCCNKLKRSVRYKKGDDENDEGRDFNPRPPNFLPIEPDPDAEKVDLRHQEMDDRRNSEEWMTDYVLQKTVNQLGPARKKKVSMLVKAFEAVLPTPKHEPHVKRRSSSASAHPPTIQACS